MADKAPTGRTTANDEEAFTNNIKYKEFPIKIPAPFLAITDFACNSTNPLDIIIATKNAAVKFDDSHMEAEDFNYEDLCPSTKNLIKWLFAVHMGLITETQLAMEPDNDKLSRYVDERHRLCILLPLNLNIHYTTNTNGTFDSVINS